MIYFMNPWVLVVWVLLSWVIGFLGRDKRFGFFGCFLVSFLFSPLIGLLVLIASDYREPPLRRKHFFWKA